MEILPTSQSWKSWTVNFNPEFSSDSFGGIEHVILLSCLSSVICEEEIALFQLSTCLLASDRLHKRNSAYEFECMPTKLEKVFYLKSMQEEN